MPVEYRVSARPVLWESALLLFRRYPAAGAGLGAFAWRLPDLLREQGRSLPLRDNPGNAYLQALSETGAIGFALTIALVVSLARAVGRGGFRAGGAAAVIGFLVVLLTGSHWFAPDVALLFFLLVAFSAREPAAEPAAGTRRWSMLLVAAYAAAALWGMLATLDPDETFRYRRGIGFHAKEFGPGGLFYWTQRRFAIRLLPGETMRMNLSHYTPEGRSVELWAESEGRTVLRRVLDPGQGIGLRLSGGASRPRVIAFALSRAFVPKRLGISSDRRELGVVAVFPSDP